MKITIVALTLCKGGAQRMLVELANGLYKIGHDVTVLMPPQGIIEYPLNVYVRRTYSNSITSRDFPRGDIIISNFYTLFYICEEASKQGKGKHIRLSLCYEPVFLNDHEASFKTYHYSKNLIVLSSWQREMIQLLHGVKGEIVPVGISKEFRNQNLRNKNKALEISCMLRKPEGGMSWHREQEYLITAFSILKNKYPHVIFNLITPPNELLYSPTLQKIHQNPQFVSYKPNTDIELNNILNRTDIFVSSSTYDSASLPGLEAMKCGATLVTVYSGGNMDYCRHNENCLLSYRHENKLVEHVTSLIENPGKRKNLSLSGEKEASRWTWENSVHLFNKAIRTISRIN
jgi:glycosyltransferase involved in cell wall biosynthesis